jgi:hypothetical protein
VIEISVYNERDMLVSYLSRCYPSYLAPAPDAEEGFNWIVFVEGPAGQMSWHVADDELSMFNHLPRQKPGEWWDGHSTPEKYDRLLALRPVMRIEAQDD